MTEREALKMALEALEEPKEHIAKHRRLEAIIAIKEALAQPEQEPVGQLLEEAYGRGQVFWFDKPDDFSMLYTIPPQRTWVGLTEEEVQDCIHYVDKEGIGLFAFAEVIEAKLKEKNT